MANPLGGRGPDLMAYLAEEKTLCENASSRLKVKGIDGEAEYEKAQVAASSCMGYLQGVVDQGYGDKQAISEQIERLQQASVTFRTWADEQLKAGHGATGVEAYEPLALATAALKLLDEQERARRKEVHGLPSLWSLSRFMAAIAL